MKNVFSFPKTRTMNLYSMVASPTHDLILRMLLRSGRRLGDSQKRGKGKKVGEKRKGKMVERTNGKDKKYATSVTPPKRQPPPKCLSAECSNIFHFIRFYQLPKTFSPPTMIPQTHVYYRKINCGCGDASDCVERDL